MSEYYKDAHRYDDLLDLPHHQSAEREHMSLHDRAAQFAPFAALTGHEAAIAETARLTDERLTLDESAVELINQKLEELAENLSHHPSAAITYFKPDGRKSGGTYLTDVGIVRMVDAAKQVVIMESGIEIPMEFIYKIEEAN